MSIDQIAGTIRFKVAGQKAYPKWVQQSLKDNLAAQTTPPESLRFQCRIAQDARENFKEVALDNGEKLTLHPKAKPQFGKNHKGHPYLTTTMRYSGDGKSYTVKWVGDAVPRKMQDVAVKHDKGMKVSAATVGLDLSRAIITPAWAEYRKTAQAFKDPVAQQAAREKYARKVSTGQHVKRKRTCARWTEEDTRQAVSA